MWIEELDNGKYKYFERYRDPLTEKLKKVSVTLDKNTSRAQKVAQTELTNKINTKLSETPGEKQTLEMIYKEWMVKYSKTSKASTVRHIQSQWKNSDNRIVKTALIGNITSGTIQKWIDKIYYEEDLSFSTTDGYKTMLSNIFRYAKMRGYISSNPVSDVRIDKKKTDKTENVEEKYLEHDELDAVIKRLTNNKRSKRYGHIVEFLSLTGLRYGELIALKYNDYDGKNVHITKTLDYTIKKNKPVATEPKNEYSRRTVSLPDRAIEIIDKIILENSLMKQTSKFYQDEDYIFTTMFGTPIYIGNVNDSLRHVKSYLKLNKKLSTHTFRHTHISQLAELNLPLKSIMERVGHHNPNTTLKIYTHVTKQMKSDLIDQLNKKISGA
ncbi:MAG: site-specific integrase [Lactococcus sp.]|nr:site-specific integrase [Lactococcus sp.]